MPPTSIVRSQGVTCLLFGRLRGAVASPRECAARPRPRGVSAPAVGHICGQRPTHPRPAVPVGTPPRPGPPPCCHGPLPAHRRRARLGHDRARGKRTIALPPPLIALLRLHREAQQAEREAAGETRQDWDLVWCMPDGSPIDAGDDWDEWKEILKEADIDKDARVHDARHTAATLLLEQGVWCKPFSATLN
ncbi:tyrosine-type recombinase/integrase [Nonomuraea indica]|uniref:Tyrosine-type recombinase/integrase n=1 Tax=Nonomuraea indica TaxID=1581193 RepID=A0ABW7ZXX4_9ACTN